MSRGPRMPRSVSRIVRAIQGDFSMHKLSIVMVSLAGFAGVAMAGSGSGATATAKDAKDAGAAKMKAPTEIADMAKQMGGTLKCKGQALGHDMKPMVDMTGTWKGGTLATDNWWIHEP